MSLVAVAAVPAAPLLVPAVSPHQPATAADDVTELRAAVRQVLCDLPALDTIVLVAAGLTTSVAARAVADLTGYGHPQARTELPVDRELLRSIAAVGSAGTVGAAAEPATDLRVDLSADLSADLAVMVLLLAAARPDVTVLPVTVAADDPVRFAAALAGAVRSIPRRVAVVAAGDLSATRDTTSPGYLVEGAVAWDEAAVVALAAGDVTTLAALGPSDAGRVDARGWAALVVLAHLAADAELQLATPRVWAPRGVGQLVVASR